MALFGTLFDRKASANSPASASLDASLRSAAGQRELRAEAVHRLQVGMFGLAGMLLLVSLANVIMDRAQSTDASLQSRSAPAAAAPFPATDPLVDMGIAPELPVVGAVAPAPKTAAPMPVRKTSTP